MRATAGALLPGPPSACDRDARVGVGLHEFRVCAWRDTWLTFCRELRLKHEADQDIALDLAEDAAHLRTALARRQARGDARPSKRPCPC
ncbi:alpha-amylase [Bordetella pertussis]|nr:alpha-amylase [Bordetella pertussis]